jgi:hypothetical protein
LRLDSLAAAATIWPIVPPQMIDDDDDDDDDDWGAIGGM